MPRQIDHVRRRRDIVRTTKGLIAEGGLASISFREIGRRLGGSTTLVTHYYATQGELLADVAANAVESWQTELEGLQERHPDPVELLNVFLFEWLVPLTHDDLVNERYRVSFVAAQIRGEDMQAILDVWESGLKALLRPVLAPLVLDDEIEQYVDMLRVTFNGLVLSTIEHPDDWDADRQLRILRAVAEGIGLPVSPA